MVAHSSDDAQEGNTVRANIIRAAQGLADMNALDVQVDNPQSYLDECIDLAEARIAETPTVVMAVGGSVVTATGGGSGNRMAGSGSGPGRRRRWSRRSTGAGSRARPGPAA